MSFEIGSSVGDYEVTGILGAGGMGKVYKVRNTISDRVEAIKVLLPDLAENSELEGRFLREIKLLAGLSHPNIAALYTALRIENQLLMVMEFVEGVTVAQRLREGPLPLTLGVDYVCQVLSALSYAHAQGIIHRDIKPANMMVTPAGIVKLMDFGIARTTTDHTLTMTGSTLGSLYYMSPEQIRSESLDGRADLYSLGVSLYEIATNRRPFRETSDFNIMAAHLQKAPVPPIQVDPSLPPALSEIIMMVMAKDRTQRFQTADAFRNALESVRPSLGPSTAVGMAGAGTITGVLTPGPETTATSFGSPAASMPPQTAPVVLPAASLTPGGLSQSTSGNAGVPAGVDGGVLAVPAAAAIPPPLTERPGPDWLRDPLPSPAPPTPVDPNIAADDKSPRRSYRGLYMTAGALVALTVIVVSATQIPKLRKAKAGGNAITQQTPVQPPSSETPGTQPGIAPTPDSSAQSGSAQTSSAQTGSATDASGRSTSLPANSGESTPAQAGLQQTDSTPSRTPSAGSTAHSGADQTPSPVTRPAEIQHPAKLRKAGPALGRSGQLERSGQSPPQPASGSPREIHNSASRSGAAAAAEQQGAPGASAASGTPAGTSVPDSADSQEAKELQKQLGLLAARGRTVQSAFEDLQKQQQAQGLSPRLDMTTSLERMKQFLDGAHDALGLGKIDEAKDSMESAEREVAKLEKFLGR